MNALLDHPPLTVLNHFAPHTDGLTWQRVPGGFSGASVWRGDDPKSPRIALKGWPAGTNFQRVHLIHAWLAQATHLSFVPRLYAGNSGQTVCAEAERVWDCCRWMPGEPRAHPSAADMGTACDAVARLHAVWARQTHRGPCPGVQNRLRVLAENEPLLRAGPDALPPVSPLLDPLLRRAVTVAARLAPLAMLALRPWEHHEFALQPCVRDLRGEHVLFDGARVSGIIDYGAAAIDFPAVDLARLLDDLANADDVIFDTGLNAYRAVRPEFEVSDTFVRLLARTGAVCSVVVWLSRLTVRRERPTHPLSVATRLNSLVSRMEQFTHF